MAGSRLHNFGTIFTRMTGLIEAGGAKEIPIWYEVYKRFPPPVEPRAERPAPTMEIREIVYMEDYTRMNKPLPKMEEYKAAKRDDDG